MADLERRGRAAVAFACAGRVEVLPARVVRNGDDLAVGLRARFVPADAVFDRITLILDDGTFWFELRAVNQRGRLDPITTPPPGMSEQLRWFAFHPTRASAWDYSTLHEEHDE
ncbi:hypothetical protein [Rhodococcus chondri]|uniref:Uncharacterized protein n=1 Tax=Rhodococcus chondri TaxID=3065941 RepID=A0ABU7JRC0_9NOCA|nr:hypothetical protein [Rhodococcus sp. CC-R104]MEE2032439.1 hypothetical protein [Rhodococcus sp. CC-R104]